MPTALEDLRNELNDLNNQDKPVESIKDVLNELLTKAESENVNGGSQPVQAFYFCEPVSINNGGGANLPWTHFDGPDLLDRTDPAEPLFVTAGTYIVTVTVFTTDPLTAGGFATVAVAAFSGGNELFLASTTSERPQAGIALTAPFQVSAGDLLELQIGNADGASPRSFGISSASVLKFA